MKNHLISFGLAVLVFVVGTIGVFHYIKTPSQPVGAVTGPDSFFPCETHNGFTVCTDRKVFNTGSTTLASFKSPSATSTLRFAAGSITTATTTATQFEWGRSTFPDSTTTSLGFYNLAASVKAVVTASTTPTNGSVVAPTVDTPYVIPPNTYVVLKYGNTLCAAGLTCSAIGGYAVVRFEY